MKHFASPLASKPRAGPSFDPELASRAELIDHIDLLQGKVDSLTQAFAADRGAKLSQAIGVSGALVRILLVLADGQLHSKQSILSGIYFDRPDDEPEIKIIDVWVCRLRKILAGTGIVIETVWGGGYVVSQGVDRLNRVIETGVLETEVGTVIPRASRSGRIHRPFGQLRDKALEFLRARADDKGRVAVRSRDLSNGVGLMNAGSGMIRSLEVHGHLVVVERARRLGGRRNSGGVWKLQLTRKGLGR